MRRALAAAAALGLLATACTSGSRGTAETGRRPGGVLRGDQVTFVSTLRSVGDCDALLAHLRREAGARVGPYGLGGGPMMLLEQAMPGTRAAAGGELDGGGAAPSLYGDDSSKATASTAPGGYSTTNVQEADVDEPDIVKTDGSRIVTITNGVLSVVDVASTAPTLRGSVVLGDERSSFSDMLIAGDTALVFGATWKDQSGGDGAGSTGSGGASSREAIDIAPSPGIPGPWYGGNVATITQVDLRDPANPVAGATLQVDGGYVTARLVGGTARVVVRSEPRNLAFVYPQNPAGEKRAAEANRQVVAESTLADWLPSYELIDPNGATQSSGLLADCRAVHAPSEFAGFGSLSVLTIDATRPLGDGAAVSVLSGGESVYASTTGLYVATTTYLDPAEMDDEDTVRRWNRDFSTSIHAFDIAGDGPAAYRASGTVPGHLLNQFSMSEHDGKLRAATTKGAPCGMAQDASESMITVLERRGATLAVVGRVGDMGRGERIFSVRYAGDVAYLVTFRQTDPFYTVDLSDPAAPRVVGELKIPGYSSYLHPIGDGLVVGVGQDATDEGRVQGTKVSLFDVSDLAAPKELAVWTQRDTSSGAEWDHRAFLWWPATDMLVLPLTDWRAGFSGAVVLRVDRSGISETGRIEHDPPPAGSDPGCPKPVPGDGGRILPCGPGVPFTPLVRSLVVGPSIWTLSATTLQANDLAGLSRTSVIPLA
jgi:hypothetical protein